MSALQQMVYMVIIHIQIGKIKELKCTVILQSLGQSGDSVNIYLIVIIR